MSKQPEALRLVPILSNRNRIPSVDECLDAASALRSQHALIAELVKALRLSREGYYSESLTGLRVTDMWRERTMGIIDAAIAKAEAQQWT